MSPSPALIVIAKSPEAGRAKTRLCPPLAPHEAAALARAALEDTLHAVGRTPATRRVLVLEGDADDWWRPGLEVIPQRGGRLDQRLAAAFEDVGGPALLVGMDTPQVTPALLAGALRDLDRPGVDAVLGPAPDGGYWAIGLRRADRRVFEGVPMSSPQTAREQLRRLRALGLRCGALAPLRDFDTFSDARAVAREAPRTRFAATLRRLGIASVGVCALAAAGCGGGDRALPPAAEPPDSPPLTASPAGRPVAVGNQPEGLAADPATGTVAVGLRHPDRLALLDWRRGAVRRRVALPAAPRHLSLAAPGGPVLVPAERADALVRVSLTGGRARATPVGEFPHDAAAVAGRVFVGDEMGDTLSVLDRGRPVRTLAVSEQPGGVAATGTGEVAVVAVRARVLETFDARSLARTATVAAGKGPTHLVSDGRGTLYVADTQGRAVRAYRVGPLRLVGRLPLPAAPYGIAIDRRRGRLWVTLPGLNRLLGYRVAGASFARLANLPTARQPNTVAVDARSGTVFVAGRDRGVVQVIAAPGGGTP